MIASGRAAAEFGRLVCVSPNTAIDKIAAVERLVPGEIHRPELLSMLPGGKALNVARAASTLGVRAGVVAVLAGHAGDWIEEALLARQIAVCGVRVPGESRTCLSILDRTSGKLTEFYERGVTVDADAWDALETALGSEAGLEPRALVAISGSLPAGAPADGYERLARVASEAGSIVAIDAGGVNLAAALRAQPWLVKVNAAEAAAAVGIETGDEGGARRAADALHGAGASIALVTRGAHAAILVSDSGCWRIGPSRERGDFPVGSGDALLAGFAAALMEGYEPPEAARRAFAVAVAHALVPGQGELRLEDVERIRPTIGLDRLV